MNQRGNYLVGEKLASEFRHIPGAVDVHVQQAFDNPTLYMEIDRARAQSVGMQSRDVAQIVLVSLSSSLQTDPALCLDPKNGVEYFVAFEEPQYPVDSDKELRYTPVR